MVIVNWDIDKNQIQQCVHFSLTGPGGNNLDLKEFVIIALLHFKMSKLVFSHLSSHCLTGLFSIDIILH